MLVEEINLRKTYYKDQMEEVDKLLSSLGDLGGVTDKSILYNKLINKKFDLVSKIMKYEVILDESNRETIIDLDGTSISIYEALKLLKSIRSKLDTFTSVISGDKTLSLDIFTIMQQRDAMFEEYIKILMAVTSSNILTEWEK